MTTQKKLGTAELLFSSAQHMGLQPSWIITNGLFTINTPRGERFVHFARSPLNSAVSVSLAKNKHLTRLVMERHQLPNIPHCRPTTSVQAEAFLQAHGTIIVKPVAGSGAQDIRIVTSADQLAGINFRAYIFEKYITGREMRYLVLADNVIAVHESEYGTSVAADRDLKRLSYRPDEWDPELVALSLRIASILGLTFAAVDYIIDNQGHAHILEVNTAPGLKWFHAPTSGPPVNVATMFLQATLTSEQ